MYILLIVAIVMILVRNARFSGPWAPRQPLPGSTIVDMHCHTAGIGGDSPNFVSEQLTKSWKFGPYLHTFGVTLEELKAQGDELILQRIDRWLRDSETTDKIVILAMDGVINPAGTLDRKRTEFYVDNQWLGETLHDYDNLLFGASINPYRQDAIEQLRWSKANGAVLLKWLPSIQMIDPADDSLDEFYKTLIELDLPLLTHVGDEGSFTQAEDRLADPQRLVRPLDLGVTVIAAHVATRGETDGEENFDRLLNLMPRYTNLYTDLSVTTQFNRRKYLPRILTDERLKGRMLNGTDHPLTNTPMTTAWQYPMQLTLQEMRDISTIANPWDRDVRLKQQLGVSADVFARAAELLKV